MQGGKEDKGPTGVPPEEHPEEPPEEIPKPPICCSMRLVLIMTSFLYIFNLSFLRIGVSMAIACIELPGTGDTTTWTAATKGYLISAGFYGFLAGPFVAGMLSYKIGGKYTLLIGTFGCGLIHFVLPHGVAIAPLFFVLRVIVGFLAGFTFPALYDLFSHWIVPEERQLLVTAALLGIPTANILNFPVSSGICHLFGWKWLFYVFGIWLIVCGGICVLTVYNYPHHCPVISKRERLFLEKNIPKTIKQKIPWKAILKSLPIHAYIVIHFCLNYYYLTLIFSLPAILDRIYNLPLRETGLLSAIPFIGSLAVRLVMSFFFETIRRKLNVTKNVLRKTFVCLGVIASTFFLFFITFVYNYVYWFVFCVFISSSCLELCLTGGYLLSLLDLCPPYVNVLTGITNTIGNAAGLVSPVVTGLITRHGTPQEWNCVVYLNVVILLAAMLFYLVFGRNDVQPWALPAMLSPPTAKPASVKP